MVAVRSLSAVSGLTSTVEMLNKRAPDVRVLAIASGGGHWVQLLRMRSAWRGCDVAYAVTYAGYRKDIEPAVAGGKPRFYVVPDANLSQKFRLVGQLVRVVTVLLRERPDVIVTTGASVGYFALRFGKLLGARTVWVDSIANADELSLSGKRAGRYADLWLTQWPELAEGSDGTQRTPRYVGSVI